MGTKRITVSKRLTALKVAKATQPGILDDGAGLRLQIDANGNKRWACRVTVAGKRVNRGLGRYPDVSLERARAAAEDLRQSARAGHDVVAERKRKEKLAAITFRDAFNTYFEEVKRPKLKPGRFAERWPESMAAYVFPIIGDRPVADIGAAEIIEVLQPYWHTKRETASRVLQRISATFKSAILRGHRQHGNPCDGVRDELGKARPPVKHRRALDWRAAPAFLRELDDRRRVTPASRLALKFIIFTCCRSEEVRGAHWSEVDANAKEWTVPASRMKMKIEHIVPLSAAALAVLGAARTLRREGCDLVFPNSNGTMLSDNTLSKLMREASTPGTPHGFRTSFKVWAAESTEPTVRDEVSEAVLAHGDPNKVRAAYRRTTFIEDRRVVMENWSDFLIESAQTASPAV